MRLPEGFFHGMTLSLKVKLRFWLFSSQLNNIHLVKLLLT